MSVRTLQAAFGAASRRSMTTLTCCSSRATSRSAVPRTKRGCSSTSSKTSTSRCARCEIYPFLGSYLLAEAIDVAGADLVIHGHAHGGKEHGVTPGGVPVRNV